jgi:hypothetical protein
LCTRPIHQLQKVRNLALVELRDGRLLAVMMAGKTSIADELVFPSQVGSAIKPDNIAPRYLERAGERLAFDAFAFTVCPTRSEVC